MERGHSRREDGSVLPIVAIMAVMLIAMVGLAVDVGRLHEERRELQNAADGAALAGARYLPESPADAIAVAQQYLGLNRVDPAGQPLPVVLKTFVDNDTIQVTVDRTVNNFFMGVLGTTQSNVGAQAQGISGSMAEGDCLLPVAALTGAPPEPAEGDWFQWEPAEYSLKQEAGGSWQGNFQGMNLNFDNNNDFFDAVGGGCFGDVYSGQPYDTRTGTWGNRFLNEMEIRLSAEPTPWPGPHRCDGTGCYYESLGEYAVKDDNGYYSIFRPSPRFVQVPVVSYEDMIQANGTEPLVIQTFATFFVTFLGCDTHDGPVPYWEGCSPGHGWLAGQFIKAYGSTGFGGWLPNSPIRVQRLWQ